ncbi:hypothetical protein [uncultured Acetobacteroides sp.]|uniref:hypothetical protein n=1 Tax=uncultured Acetobacteroides sp. TaxID=1760811 RepID=UPI0029F56F26|nr:hypothetical protein [uncultured Acetobacteroides sp.]
MSEIKIYDPINLELSIIEIDNLMPSFKIEMRISLSELKGESKLIVTFWVSNESWDRFIEDPYNGLVDFDETIRLLIIQGEIGDYFFEVNTSFQTITKGIYSILRVTIKEEEKNVLLDKFKSITKWW